MPKQPPKRSQTAKHSAKQADAVHMLKADHKAVKQLFERFHSAPSEEQSLIAGRLFKELDIHTRVEEELFYPALLEKLKPAGSLESSIQGNGLDIVDEDDLDEDTIDGMDLDLESDEEEEDDEELITVAYDEHQAAKDLIEQLKTLDPKGSDYRELFIELEESVIEHITGEEDVLLPMAASELDVQTLGAKMQQRRADLLSSLAA